MPIIHPQQLLTTLSVLLDDEGGIVSSDQVQRSYNLMKRFSKKIVSKSIYVLMLKSTKSEILDQFLRVGGWSLINTWLNETQTGPHWLLMREIMLLLDRCPVDTSLLKQNNTAKVVKLLAKECPDEETKVLALPVYNKWLAMVNEYQIHSGTPMVGANGAGPVADAMGHGPNTHSPSEVVEVDKEDEDQVEDALEDGEGSPSSMTSQSQEKPKLKRQDSKSSISSASTKIVLKKSADTYSIAGPSTSSSASKKSSSRASSKAKLQQLEKEREEQLELKKKVREAQKLKAEREANIKKEESKKHHSSSSKSKEKERDKSKEKDKDRDRERSKDREKDRDKEKEKQKHKDKEKDKDKKEGDKDGKRHHHSGGSSKSKSKESSSSKKEHKESSSSKLSKDKAPGSRSPSTSSDSDAALKLNAAKYDPSLALLMKLKQTKSESTKKTVKTFSSAKSRTSSLIEDALKAQAKEKEKDKKKLEEEAAAKERAKPMGLAGPKSAPPKVHMIRESTGFLEALTAPPVKPIKKKKPTPPQPVPSPPVLPPLLTTNEAPTSSVPPDISVRQERPGGIKLLDGLLPVPPQLLASANKADARSVSPDEKGNQIKEFNFYKDTLTAKEEKPLSPGVKRDLKEESTDGVALDAATPNKIRKVESTPGGDDMDVDVEPESAEDVERNATSPLPVGRKAGGILVKYDSGRNKAKLPVRWRDENLVETCFFELDETERVNVNKLKFKERQMQEMMLERDGLRKAKLINTALEPQIPWNPVPIQIKVPKQLEFGKDSEEKGRLDSQNIFPANPFYVMRMEGPDEPAPESRQAGVTTVILLEDSSDPRKSADNFKDYRKKEWPMPSASSAHSPPPVGPMLPVAPMPPVGPLNAGNQVVPVEGQRWDGPGASGDWRGDGPNRDGVPPMNAGPGPVGPMMGPMGPGVMNSGMLPNPVMPGMMPNNMVPPMMGPNGGMDPTACMQMGGGMQPGMPGWGAGDMMPGGGPVQNWNMGWGPGAAPGMMNQMGPTGGPGMGMGPMGMPMGPGVMMDGGVMPGMQGMGMGMGPMGMDMGGGPGPHPALEDGSGDRFRGNRPGDRRRGGHRDRDRGGRDRDRGRDWDDQDRRGAGDRRDNRDRDSRDRERDFRGGDRRRGGGHGPGGGRDKEVCTFFIKTGWCRYEDKCIFHHPNNPRGGR